ncbi:hypothetical protein FRB96_005115 [Tulasnella sp. 330]|nr:hypothetical protein FRB96_005115 [Tulasnella sp. 330]KAG8881487.1 hypothetical protein FRB97_009541 [Tulasnella sp. 331]KAG8887576.1 hypothetical protein FRB98_009418 [Tulasnella sp. 332]
MLRRDPTPINLRDSDVQELREMMALKDKAKMELGTAAADPKPTAGPADSIVNIEEAKKRRAAMSTNERVGLITRI